MSLEILSFLSGFLLYIRIWGSGLGFTAGKFLRTPVLVCIFHKTFEALVFEYDPGAEDLVEEGSLELRSSLFGFYTSNPLMV